MTNALCEVKIVSVPGNRYRFILLPISMLCFYGILQCDELRRSALTVSLRAFVVWIIKINCVNNIYEQHVAVNILL